MVASSKGHREIYSTSGGQGEGRSQQGWSSPQPWRLGLATWSPNTRHHPDKWLLQGSAPRSVGRQAQASPLAWVWFAGNKGTHRAGSPLSTVRVRLGILGEALLRCSGDASSNQQVRRVSGVTTRMMLADKACTSQALRTPWGFVTWAEAAVPHPSPSSSGPGPRPPELAWLGWGRLCEGLGTPGSRCQLSK